jgi:hypothetical protein
MPPQTPTLSDVISEALDSRLEDVQTAMPGRIVSFDSDTCTANVQPTVKRIYTREDGTEFAANLPVIPNVPVLFPGSGSVAPGGVGSFGMTFPINKGDEVLLVFSSVSLDAWKLSRDKIVAPKNFKPHALTDAVAIVGLRTIPNAMKSTAGNGTAYAGPNYLTVHGDDIRLGGIGANDPVVRKSDLQAVVTALNSLISKYNLHTHAVATVGTAAAQSGTAAATLSTESTATCPNCSTVVKCEPG